LSRYQKWETRRFSQDLGKIAFLNTLHFQHFGNSCFSVFRGVLHFSWKTSYLNIFIVCDVLRSFHFRYMPMPRPGPPPPTHTQTHSHFNVTSTCVRIHKASWCVRHIVPAACSLCGNLRQPCATCGVCARVRARVRVCGCLSACTLYTQNVQTKGQQPTFRRSRC